MSARADQAPRGVPLDEVDREILEAELDARLDSQAYQPRPSDEIERPASSSYSPRDSTHIPYNSFPVSMSRVPTQGGGADEPEHLMRILTERSQHDETVGRRVTTRRSSIRRRAKPLPAFGADKPYPPMLPEQEAYVVEFDGPNDPIHAQNWPLRKKIIMAGLLGYTTLTSAFASSVFSPTIPAIAAEFNVSSTVATLGLTFFVLGFAFGPSFWAPLSELRGRRLPIVLAMFGFTIFSIAAAVAKDIQTVVISRFFAGLFGAGPLSVVAAVFADMFDNRTRGIAITIFSMTVFTGPMFAPFVGGYVMENPTLGWRWTQWIPAIMGAAAFLLDLFFVEETYPPVILVQKASELRRRTLNWGIHAKQEEIEVDFRELVSHNFSRPMRLLFNEPIVLLLTIYTAFIYGLLYLFITAYPAVYQRVHGFGQGASGLPFIGLIVGQILAGIFVLAQQPWYMRKLAANNGVPIPEWRLPTIIVGGVSFTIGIFWFGWTGFTKDIHWIVPTISGIFTGFGLLCIFLQAINYLVDAYLMFAASAIAANTFLRSLAGAGFPLFAQQMFKGMGIQWAATLLGCVAVVLVPIPVIFYIYGARLRARSSFAPTPAGGFAEKKDEGENAV
ncbi:probable fluconazole resistance protein [Cephalotrichum gorgonifer]|uniref:Probable fluconazole resistance protein n=1 Tax=Cephalotrichum gorgonifer TaxID=2041049 RepID=A0AAE8SW68_9PEZI|nr:probable fluconazole resistance protein [Cephalotrichum gorgonifer]